MTSGLYTTGNLIEYEQHIMFAPPPPPGGPHDGPNGYGHYHPPSAPRQRTAIACRYCRRRKIRCSGFEQSPIGRCANCVRFNQECVFHPVSSQTQAFVPAQALVGNQHQNGQIYYGPQGQPLPANWVAGYHPQFTPPAPAPYQGPEPGELHQSVPSGPSGSGYYSGSHQPGPAYTPAALRRNSFETPASPSSHLPPSSYYSPSSAGPSQSTFPPSSYGQAPPSFSSSSSVAEGGNTLPMLQGSESPRSNGSNSPTLPGLSQHPHSPVSLPPPPQSPPMAGQGSPNPNQQGPPTSVPPMSLSIVLNYSPDAPPPNGNNRGGVDEDMLRRLGPWRGPGGPGGGSNGHNGNIGGVSSGGIR